MAAHPIQYIDDVEIKNKRVLLRADFDVSLHPDFTIANDVRITQNLPTLKYLLKKNNKVICIAKLGRPKGKDGKYSLQIVVDRLQEYLPDYKVRLVPDFMTDETLLTHQKEDEILVLENIRFYPEELKNDEQFAKKLAGLADVYINDAFSMCHRQEASIVGVPKFIPGYGGILLKKEISMITKAINNPKKPVVSIIGGAKISTKLPILKRLIEISDYLLLGGALANVFLVAEGLSIGSSLFESAYVDDAKKLLAYAKKKNTKVMMPTDVVCNQKHPEGKHTSETPAEDLSSDCYIVDIGSETRTAYGWIIDKAKTIIWNGPMGYIENSAAREGTDFIYYCITSNEHAITLVGGGDTLAAISKEEYLEKITHISTGGGAMIELIEKGTLPGIKALEQSTK